TATLPDGTPLLTVEDITARPVNPQQLATTARHQDTLLQLTWIAPSAEVTSGGTASDGWAIVGTDATTLATVLPDIPTYSNLAALQTAIATGPPAPRTVLLPSATPTEPSHRPDQAAHHMLRRLQDWLTADQLSASRLVVVTHHALATHDGEDVHD